MADPLFITNVAMCDDSQWLSLCQNLSHTTFFHTPHWADIFCNSGRYQKKRCYAITFNDNAQILLPIVTESRFGGLFTRNVSMAAGTFGGFLYDQSISQGHLKLALKKMLSKGNWLIRENPYDPLISSIDLQYAQDDFTQCVDIKNGYETVHSEPTHRNKVRQAVASGLSVCSTENWDDWLQYYDVYKQSMSRWKQKGLSSRSVYTIDEFEQIFKLAPSMRKLWLAKKESQIAAGIICFYWNKHVAVWHGSGSETFFKIRPNNLLYDTALRDACDSKFHWFDCNPSGGYEGVIQFKKHLGAQKIRSRVIEKKTVIVNLLQSLKNLIKTS